MTDTETTTPAAALLREWDAQEYDRVHNLREHATAAGRLKGDSYWWSWHNRTLAARFPERHRQETTRLAAAFKLASDLPTLESLLRGERVPIERIHPHYRHLWASDSSRSQTT